ncbi:unnamed protein product [Medioppia subpectinata]|uniref:Uncharacterized protein n=1 Tax=Medioppia subpectinata TaxID=1979941 RepID=A0A7R9PXX5_9ACAR|nr:unnamed protein product [Medioppia subpectinata]CAG2105269.1 unnamed protein product [Medioppia subpectinata]
MESIQTVKLGEPWEQRVRTVQYSTGIAVEMRSSNILASATASISTHGQTSRSTPRISIQVKVEENSVSSAEDNSNGDGCNGSAVNAGQQLSAGNNWPNACIYKCNISADARRYVYSEDKCLEPDIESSKNQENETNLIALRDQFLCNGSAFTTNAQQNSQHYNIVDN